MPPATTGAGTGSLAPVQWPMSVLVQCRFASVATEIVEPASAVPVPALSWRGGGKEGGGTVQAGAAASRTSAMPKIVHRRTRVDITGYRQTVPGHGPVGHRGSALASVGITRRGTQRAAAAGHGSGRNR